MTSYKPESYQYKLLLIRIEKDCNTMNLVEIYEFVLRFMNLFHDL